MRVTADDTTDNGRYPVSPRINTKSLLFQGNNKFSQWTLYKGDPWVVDLKALEQRDSGNEL
jgi:hypothetical protein